MGTLLIVLLILLLLYSDRLANVGRGLGRGVREFKRSLGSAAAAPPEPTAPPEPPEIRQAPPKLLPAKGEMTRRPEDEADRE